jgi:hypothetical protein
MRSLRALLLGVGAALLAACGDDSGTNVPDLPPLAGVRFINALPDTGDVDIRAIDQIEFSPVANALRYRSATQYWPTQAGARHLRVFVTSLDPAVTSQYLVDTTVTFEAGVNYTLLLTGSGRNNTEHFVVLQDVVPDVQAGNINLRAVNASTDAMSLYLTNVAGDPLPAQPAVDGVAFGTASAYLSRAAGDTYARYTLQGDVTTSAAAAGPKALGAVDGGYPAPGVDASGSAFSVIFFPRTVAGSGAPQGTAFQSAAAVYYVDRHPPRQ